jgi:hypothetical protein
LPSRSDEKPELKDDGATQNQIDFCRENNDAMLNWALDAALRIADTNTASLPFVDPDSGALRIAVQRGFDQPFLDYFGWVCQGKAAGGEILKAVRESASTT